MGRITTETPWSDISEYVLMNSAGVLYSLATDKSDYIKTRIRFPYMFTVVTINGVKCASLILSSIDSLFLRSRIPTLTTGTMVDSSRLLTVSPPDGFISVFANSDITPLNSIDEYMPMKADISNIVASKPLFMSVYDPSLVQQTITEVFRIFKKKVEYDLSYSTILDLKNQELNYRNDTFDKSTYTKYCCTGQNFMLPECSTLGLNNREINGKLYYAVVATSPPPAAVISNAIQTKPILNYIIINNPINNISIPTVGYSKILIEGSINVPVTESYTFQLTSNVSLNMQIGSNKMLQTSSGGVNNTTTIMLQQGKYPLTIYLESLTSSNISLDVKYLTSKMTTMKSIPAEWFSAKYYYNVNTIINDAINTSCSTATDWYTSRCYPYISNNVGFINNNSKNIIDRCKLGGPGTDTAECKKLYISNSPNYNISKSYCSENDRVMTDPECKLHANADSSLLNLQINYCLAGNNFMVNPACELPVYFNQSLFKQKQIDYCASSPTNWKSPACQQLVNPGNTIVKPGLYPNDSEFYDKYCITNKNALVDYNTCKAFYSEDTSTTNGKKLVNSVIDMCATPDSKLFSTSSCLTGLPNPQYITDAITAKRTNLCKSDVTNALCTNEVKNYDIYGNNINEYCSTNNFQNITKPVCTQILTADDPTLPPNGGKLTDNNIKLKLYTTKLNYCNQPNTFTNDSCKSWVVKGANINEYDLLFKNNCSTDVNKSVEPCLTVNNPSFTNLQAIPQFNKDKTSKCVDQAGLLVQSDECISRNTETNPFYTTLIEPTMKYCSENNNITNPQCTKYINDLTAIKCDVFKSESKSGFKDRVNSDNNYGCWNLLLLFICIICIAIIFKKDTLFNHSVFKKDNTFNYSIFKKDNALY